MDGTYESNEHAHCAKCFKSINPIDKVSIQGQNFHRGCAICCMCRTIPTSLIMISGNIFCEKCYDKISRQFGNPVVKTNGWWLHWAPQFCHYHECPKPTSKDDEDLKKKEANVKDGSGSPTKCLRCLQNIADDDKLVINGKPFHTECARCCVCHVIPKSAQIYYGSVFCDKCFQRHIMNRNNETATDFFKACFEQYERNLEFAENIGRFMASSGHRPTIFVVPPPQNNRCGQNVSDNDRSEPKCEYTK